MCNELYPQAALILPPLRIFNDSRLLLYISFQLRLFLHLRFKHSLLRLLFSTFYQVLSFHSFIHFCFHPFTKSFVSDLIGSQRDLFDLQLPAKTVI
jgi:hypothetical protein